MENPKQWKWRNTKQSILQTTSPHQSYIDNFNLTITWICERHYWLRAINHFFKSFAIFVYNYLPYFLLWHMINLYGPFTMHQDCPQVFPTTWPTYSSHCHCQTQRTKMTSIRIPSKNSFWSQSLPKYPFPKSKSQFQRISIIFGNKYVSQSVCSTGGRGEKDIWQKSVWTRIFVLWVFLEIPEPEDGLVMVCSCSPWRYILFFLRNSPPWN